MRDKDKTEREGEKKQRGKQSVKSETDKRVRQRRETKKNRVKDDNYLSGKRSGHINFVLQKWWRISAFHQYTLRFFKVGP